MLGIVLLYFIGKSFYTLAGDHNRSQWGFAILGIVTYYALMFAGQIIVILLMTSDGTNIDSLDDYLVALTGIPFGLLGWWGLYSLLKKQWSQNPINKPSNEILDDGLLDD